VCLSYKNVKTSTNQQGKIITLRYHYILKLFNMFRWNMVLKSTCPHNPIDDQKMFQKLLPLFKHVILLDQITRQNPQSLPRKILMNLSKLDWSWIWKIVFYSKSYKIENWKESVPEARIQSCKHISVSIVFGVNRVRKSNIILQLSTTTWLCFSNSLEVRHNHYLHKHDTLS